MSTIEQFITDFHIWGIVKSFYLLAIGVYIMFAILVVRQIYLMVSTLKGRWNLPLKTLGFLHLFLAIFIFLLALVVL